MKEIRSQSMTEEKLHIAHLRSCNQVLVSVIESHWSLRLRKEIRVWIFLLSQWEEINLDMPFPSPQMWLSLRTQQLNNRRHLIAGAQNQYLWVSFCKRDHCRMELPVNQCAISKDRDTQGPRGPGRGQMSTWNITCKGLGPPPLCSHLS